MLSTGCPSHSGLRKTLIESQLLGVLGGDVSAVRSATGARLYDTSFIYPVTVAVRAKCSDSLSLWMRSNPPKIFLKRGNIHTLF